MMTTVDGLNTKLTSDLVALNAKVDAIKAAQDVNDDYVKQTVDGNITKIWEMLSTITDGITQMNVKIAVIEAAASTNPPGLGGTFNGASGLNTTFTTNHNKSIMEVKAIQSLGR